MRYAALGITLALGMVSCGPPSQIDAVNQGASHACNYYKRCGLIGSQSGATYPDYQHCIIALQGQLNSYWPSSQCTGHISSNGLSACLSGMDNTQCNNGADLWNTVTVKCPPSAVCSA